MPELARSFGRIASDYDVARPEYATEAVDRAADVLELGPDAHVVDLAAGSGTLTRALSERFRDVVAVEPDEEMRAVLAERAELKRELLPLLGDAYLLKLTTVPYWGRRG